MSSLDERRLQKWAENLKSSDTELCISSAKKLGNLGDPKAIPALIAAMEHRTPVVSAAAARALGQIGDKAAVSALVKVVRNHQDATVQTAAIQSLGKIGDESAIPALSQTIDDYIAGTSGDRMSRIRGYNYGLLTEAVYALRQIGTPKALKAASKADQL